MDFQLNEKLIKTAYQSILVYLFGIIISFILILGDCFFIVFLWRFGWWGQSIFCVILLIGLLILLRTIILMVSNRLIITNQRLVFVYRRGLWQQEIFKVNYDQIREVKLIIKGLIATIFHLGSLNFYLKEVERPVIFSHLYNAEQIQELINQVGFSRLNSNWQDLEEYQLIDLIRKIRNRLGRDILRRIVDED